MKKHLFRRGACFLLTLAVLLGSFGFVASAGASVATIDVTNPKGDENTAATLAEMQSVVGTVSYQDYLAALEQIPAHTSAAHEIEGPLFSGGKIGTDATTANVHLVKDDELCLDSYTLDQSLWREFNWALNADRSVYLPSTGSATFEFSVDIEGMYFIQIEYFNPQTEESSISTTERKFYIDDQLPFKEASTLSFPKSWIFEDNDASFSGEDDRPAGIYYEILEDGYYKTVVTEKDGVKTAERHRITQDINGNSMAPTLRQYSKWSTYFVHDSTGYYTENFSFFFSGGAAHTITLEAQREPMIIRSITLIPDIKGASAQLISYEQFKQNYADKSAPEGGEITVLEAEFPDFVSDSSVYATNDNTSAETYPVTPRAQLYNVIGENSYNTVGQWAAYKFTVNASGMYKIAMRYKQDALQGMYICRTLKLAGGDYGLADGTPTAPFAEAYNCKFDYDKKWQSAYIADGSGTEFEFYFEKGTEYTLYLECSLGSLKELIQRVETSLTAINDCYLRILQLTGSDPDEYRDYDFLNIMPDVLVTLLKQALELEDVKNGLQELAGTNGSHIATLETIARLLDKMGTDDGNYIAANMSNLKSYLGTLGTWINNSKRCSMMVDSIRICPADTAAKKLPRANANFFKSAWFEIRSFFFSFFTKYDQMGLTTIPDKDSEQIEVWLATGRDQSSIWRSMIDAADGYTEATGVAVTLKLVTGGTLLPSILSRKGPDVYMGLGASDVINYAIREAVMGVSGNDKKLSDEDNAVFRTTYYTYFDKTTGKYSTETAPRDLGGDPNVSLTFTTKNFSDVIGDTDRDGRLTDADSANFVQAALDTITLLDVTYGIPQTMSFSMMFYRMDVLAELGAEVPQTWDQLLALLPVLQTNNMSIGLSYGAAIDFMLYQRGGNMWKYTDPTVYDSKYAGAKIGLSEDVALEAFQYTCRLYTDYSFPVSYDAANRFRTGEMPIIIGDYAGIYNQLVVYATELEGMWEFCSLPGTLLKDEEGNNIGINYNSLAGVGSTVMLHGCKDVRAAWQYMQWQTGEKVQANYGNKMVALIGPSAKYESANIHALKNLSWTASEKEAIEAQMSHLSSVVNYPGSYIIGRYTKFAFLAAVNKGENPVEALSQYIDTINAEITRKREEFDLETVGSEDPPTLTQSSD